MSQRTTHIVTSECDIYVQRITSDCVRCRIVEKDPELLNPTDFEIEGSPAHIGEALAAIVVVLNNIETLLQEPS
jgi:hypothetical protein